MINGDSLFQYLKRINDNANKIGLSSNYQENKTFDIHDISPLDVLKNGEFVDLRPYIEDDMISSSSKHH